MIAEFETLIMAGVADEGPIDGTTLQGRLREFAGDLRTLSAGAIWSTLDRLENKGLLLSWYATPVEGNSRKRRMFVLTKLGEHELAAAREMMSRLLSRPSIHRVNLPDR